MEHPDGLAAVRAQCTGKRTFGSFAAKDRLLFVVHGQLTELHLSTLTTPERPSGAHRCDGGDAAGWCGPDAMVGLEVPL